MKLLRRDGNFSMYETVAEAEGRKMTSVTRISSQPNQKLEAETIDGDGKGTKMTFTFTNIPEGTQLTLRGEIVPPGFAKILGSLLKGRIEAGMKEELVVIKKAIEST